jgi:1,4-dihydroxy-2-naphthoate octaprenyltransferase
VKGIRITLAVVLGVVAAFFLYATLTVPMISATAPAILTLGTAAAAWFAWPRTKERRGK